MFKTEKHKFIELITSRGFEPSLFEASDDGNEFAIKIRSSNFVFKIEVSNPYSQAWQNEFQHKYPLVQLSDAHGRNILSLDELYQHFDRWLNNHASKFIEEMQTPDLWSQINDLPPFFGNNVNDDRSYDGEDSRFTDSERKDVQESIANLKNLIEREFALTQDQMMVVTERLDYLSDGLDRLNRFDWTGLMIMTLIAIAVALTLSPEQGGTLFELGKQVFPHLPRLIL